MSIITITIFIIFSTNALKKDSEKDNFLIETAITQKEALTILNNNDEVTIYFYTPTCSHCKKTTQLLSEINEKNNVKIKTFNLQNFEEGWEKYNIKGTPTIIHYKKGKEEKRLLGEHSQKEYREWLEDRKGEHEKR